MSEASQLSALARDFQARTIAEIFAEEPDRAARCRLSAGPLELDFSRHAITETLWDALLQQLQRADWRACMTRICAGFPVNGTENRPALHPALRDPDFCVARGLDATIAGEIRTERARLLDMANRLGEGVWPGMREPTDILHLGVGGSLTGPRLLCHAFAENARGPRVHFASSPDLWELRRVLATLDPAHTLVVVASKSFDTPETLLNARTAGAWLESALGDGAARHLVGISANADAMAALGIPPDCRLHLWDWVGGRYSVWSSVSLVAAASLGTEIFEEFLAGAAAADRHAFEASEEENLPLRMALLAYFYTGVLGWDSRCLLPYDYRLAWLPQYLAQLEMESLGKSVDAEGNPVRTPTGAVTWGGLGPSGQHSFFQLLQQGGRQTQVEFIGVAEAGGQAMPLRQLEAQSRVLAFGDAAVPRAGSGGKEQGGGAIRAGGGEKEQGGDKALPPHLRHPGNRPNSILMLDELTPRNLGFLLATWEHMVCAWALLLGINPFDQPGVERGKQVAAGLDDGGEAPLG